MHVGGVGIKHAMHRMLRGTGYMYCARIVPQHAFLEQKQNAPSVRFKIARQILMFALESLMKTTTLGRICVIVTIPILSSTQVQTAQAKVLTTIVMA